VAHSVASEQAPPWGTGVGLGTAAQVKPFPT
jgi:hypothetical protein